VRLGDRVFHHQLGWGIIKRFIAQVKNKGLLVDFGYTKEFVGTDEIRMSEEKLSPSEMPKDTPSVASEEMETENRSTSVESEILSDLPGGELTDAPKNKGLLVDLGYTKEPVEIHEISIPAHTGSSPSETPKDLLSVASEEMETEDRPRSVGAEILSDLPKGVIFDLPLMTEARKGVLALRLGQILESHVSQLSVGTSEIEKLLMNQVLKAKQRQPSCILIEGEWGGGKTHVLTLLKAMAHREGFSTSSVVMDGLAVSLSDSMQLMEELLSSLSFPKHVPLQNVGELIHKIVKEGKIPHLKTNGAPDLGYLLEKVPLEAFDDPEALGHLQDYFSLSLSASQVNQKLKQLGYYAARVPTIRVNKVIERTKAFCVLLTNWSNLVSVIGTRGLLVVLDELDVEYASTAYSDQASLRKRTNRRQLLMDIRDQMKQRAPLIVTFASAPAGGDIPIENDGVEDILQIFGKEVVHIKVPVPKENDLISLFGKLKSMYNQAYDCSGKRWTTAHLDAVMDSLLYQYRREGTAVPRKFVRSAIEVFDLLSVCEKPIDEVMKIIGVGKQ